MNEQLHRQIPVSYTHLDVYKRQFIRRSRFRSTVFRQTNVYLLALDSLFVEKPPHECGVELTGILPVRLDTGRVSRGILFDAGEDSGRLELTVDWSEAADKVVELQKIEE